MGPINSPARPPQVAGEGLSGLTTSIWPSQVSHFGAWSILCPKCPVS